MQLAIPILRKGDPLFRQVYSGVRQAILSGVLRPAERLLSTRDLAEQLDLSRTVVLLAYDHLLAGGFVTDEPHPVSLPIFSRSAILQTGGVGR